MKFYLLSKHDYDGYDITHGVFDSMSLAINFLKYNYLMKGEILNIQEWKGNTFYTFDMRYDELKTHEGKKFLTELIMQMRKEIEQAGHDEFMRLYGTTDPDELFSGGIKKLIALSVGAMLLTTVSLIIENIEKEGRILQGFDSMFSHVDAN